MGPNVCIYYKQGCRAWMLRNTPIDTKLGQLVKQQPTGNTEMRYSCLSQSYHLGLLPPFGPDSPLALVSLLPGQTGLFSRVRCQGKQTQRSGTRDFNLTPTITHLETENRQNVWLKVKQDTAEKQECEVDRGPLPSGRSQASKGGKASPLNSACMWPST